MAKDWSPDKRELIINLKDNGYKISEISRILSIHESTSRSVIKAYKNMRSVKTATRSGRPRKASVRGDARLLRAVKNNHEKVFKIYYK